MTPIDPSARPERKSSTPPRRVVLIERTLLLDRIQENLGRRLTIIDAPVGYGKTTLLSQLRSRLVRHGIARIWVPIERGICDPAFLVALLEQAVRADLGIQDFVGRSLTPLLRLASLVSKIGDTGAGVCLIVDDAQYAQDSACLELFQLLIYNSPPSLHVVIATTDGSAFPVSGLRLEDEVHEITVNDLKFDESDTRALFTQPPDEQVSKQLTERLEGWPVAMQLMQLSDDGSTPLMRQVGRLSGTKAQMADYLNECVLNHLPQELRHFLLETAHLDRLNGELADAVCGRNDGWTKIRALRTAGAPMSRCDEPEDGWYRHHRPLAEFLRHRQSSLGREHVDALRLRAADWFFRAGDLLSANRHAKAGNDHARAIRYMEEAGGVRVGFRQGAVYLQSLLDRIPTTLIHASPRVKLCSAYVLAKEGRIAESHRTFDEVITENTLDDGELADEITLLGVLLQIYKDRTVLDEDIARLDDMILTTPESKPLACGQLHNLLCMAQVQAGYLSSARLSAERSLAYYRDLDLKYPQFFVYLNISKIDLEEGLLSDALETRTSARDLVAESCPDDKGLAGIATVLLSEVHLERGDLTAAGRHLFEALRDIEAREGWSELYLSGYAVAMEVSFARDGLEAAAGILDRAERTSKRRNMDRLQRLVCYKRLDLFVRAGRADLAERTLRDIERLAQVEGEDDRPCWRGRFMAAFAQARYHIRFGDTGRALELLNHAVPKAAETNAVRFHLKGLILQSMALHRAGDSRAAAVPFKRAVALASSHAFFGCFLEEGEPLAASVQAIVRTTGIGDMGDGEVEFVARLLSELCTGENGYAAHILSVREREVMLRLAQGHSNKLIAREIGLSEPTVKFHLKNIYSKLGVNKRALAVSVARRHGLDQPPSPPRWPQGWTVVTGSGGDRWD